MNVWSVYSLADGLFTGQTISVIDSELAANTPPGCGLAAGSWAPSRWRFNASENRVEKIVSPRPEDCEDFVWRWDAQHERWDPLPTLKRVRVDRLALVDRAILQAEAGTDRALRDLVIAAGLPLAAVARMQAIEASVASLRAVRQQLLDADTIEALLAAEIPAQP